MRLETQTVALPVAFSVKLNFLPQEETKSAVKKSTDERIWLEERVRITGGWRRKLYNEGIQSVVRYRSGDQILEEAIVRGFSTQEKERNL
jgi:hypothetical protein